MRACWQIALPRNGSLKLTIDEETPVRGVRFDAYANTEGVELGIHVAVARRAHRARPSHFPVARCPNDDAVGAEFRGLDRHRWRAVVLAVDGNRRLGHVRTHENSRHVRARRREANRHDTFPSRNDGHGLLDGLVAGRSSDDDVLSWRQPAFGCGSDTDVVAVETDDRPGHVRDDAETSQIRRHADRRIDRDPLPRCNRDDLGKRLVALAWTSDLDQVLAGNQSVDDQRGGAALLAVDEDGDACHVGSDEERSGVRRLCLKCDGDRHDLSALEIDPPREGLITAFSDLNEVPTGR